MDPLLNAQTIVAIQRQRQMGFGWRWDGMGDWTTEAIFAKLHELGIDTDPERFAAQAKQSGGCSALRDSWTQGKERYDLWDDFPFLAAEELWHRLTPDLLCPEIVSRYMDKVIRTSEGGAQYRPDSENGPLLQAALPLLDYLESFPANERAKRYQEVSACTIYDYQEVLLDAIMNEGGELPDEATRLADVLSQADPDCAASYQGDLPFALVYAGRREQALERIQANLARFPDDVWIRMHAGDVYRELGEDADALEFYISAMKATTDPSDWDVFLDRAMGVLQTQGRTEEGEDLQRKAPRPAESTARTWTYSPPAPPPSRSAVPTPVVSQVPFQKGPKIGANDPCSCGSGKKYKKCCKR
jgi:hypothetical protein